MKTEQTFTITYSNPLELLDILEKKHNILVTGHNSRELIGDQLGIELNDHQWKQICYCVWADDYNHNQAEIWLENLESEFDFNEIFAEWKTL